jgi:hypothetical protein
LKQHERKINQISKAERKMWSKMMQKTDLKAKRKNGREIKLVVSYEAKKCIFVF